MPTAREITRFSEAIAARLGLRVDPERAVELLERRVAARRQPIAVYLNRVDDGEPAEIRALTGELTIGETYFLRHIEQFRAFSDAVVPDRLARGRLSILSAGCSSGEETYTLAMLLREAYPAAVFTIHGVDLNPASVARARAGRYSPWSLRAVTPEFEQRWFERTGREIAVVPEIRNLVTFENVNLLDDGELAMANRWDVVFCRNVLMYFTEAQSDAVLARFARALAPGGYLFLGHAETLRGRNSDFTLCHSHGAFYYQRLSAGPLGIATTIAIGPVDITAPSPRDSEWVDDIHAASARVKAMVDGMLAPAMPAIPPVPVISAPQAIAHAAHPPAPVPPQLDEIYELLAEERFGEALARLDRLRAHAPGERERSPSDVNVALLRAVVLTQAGRFGEARTACGELLALDAGNAGANYLLALCCESAGDPGGAVDKAQLAARLDPSFAMARVHLGLLARRIGDRVTASSELTRAIALLEHEAPARLALFGGGFSRQTLLGMCRAELAAVGAPR